MNSISYYQGINGVDNVVACLQDAGQYNLASIIKNKSTMDKRIRLSSYIGRNLSKIKSMQAGQHADGTDWTEEDWINFLQVLEAQQEKANQDRADRLARGAVA